MTTDDTTTTGRFAIQEPAGQAPAGQAPTGQAPAGPRADAPAGLAKAPKAAESARPRSAAGNPPGLSGPGPLLPPESAARLTDRLERAVGGFVDDPVRAVRAADEALDETVRLLADGLRERHAALRGAWQSEDADQDRTEALRLSLRSYRDLLRQLLAA
ncbi:MULTISPECIES: hypothetical protein [Kitasatospora]|uniref:Uncharacterized protein n=1 Tax=Kitasatospora setae (strain ATCC 33774 / DSM 43861 / JCM 3304 / KCC A-0304 / NBRC 14216 / KM-6054) TaxID=452652 RepID=E4N2U6_KITSK|nr:MULTISPECIES: hypothetical protein [Kitasatospora]BAJ32480.1 hypothetical protein KSE_67220 [Kitasatospora setae KM-6054]